MEKYLTGSGILTAAIVILALAWAFNIICSAVMNWQKAKEKNGKPIEDLRAEVDGLKTEVQSMDSRFNEMCRAVNGRVDAVEHSVEEHTGKLSDLHTGQTELCRGVQALLEHALHNGNEQGMSEASQSIGEWLRTR